MDQVLGLIRFVRDLQIPMIAYVSIAALLAALIQQRMARARTPDFSAGYANLDRKALRAAKPRHSPTTYHD
jgi:hypothetical protein